jgi:plastocyanin
MKRWIVIGGLIVVALVVTAGVAIAVLGSGLGESAAGDVKDGPGDAGATKIAMGDNFFQPTSVNVPTGTTVQFELTNNGQVNHNFTSDALKVSTGPMTPGQVKTLSVAVPAGTTQFLCTWHPGMVISVTGS